MVYGTYASRCLTIVRRQHPSFFAIRSVQARFDFDGPQLGGGRRPRWRLGRSRHWRPWRRLGAGRRLPRRLVGWPGNARHFPVLRQGEAPARSSYSMRLKGAIPPCP